MRSLFVCILLLVAPLMSACEPALLTPLDEEGNDNVVTNNATTGNNSTSANNATVTNPYAGDMAAAVDGQALYTSSACASCHGVMGEGTVSFPALDATSALSDGEVFDSIYDGRTGTAMSAFGDANGGPLSEDDTWKVVTFVRTLED